MPNPMKTITAFAPASIGNLAVGFDILGCAVPALGDKVTATRTEAPGVVIAAIGGLDLPLPTDPARNTAGKAALAILDAGKADFGASLVIHKGVPLGSGLGGSAASAVAAAVAVNALLPRPLDPIAVLKCAMQGEAVASGSLHVDNIAPSLFGGIVLTVGIDEPRVISIPAPSGIAAIVVHPRLVVATEKARGILKRSVDLSDFVWQSANLAGFIAACYRNDLDLLRASFEDVVIEPQRQALIPGFAKARAGAMQRGALGCSISGAGPTIFAWAPAAACPAIGVAIAAAFAAEGLDSTQHLVPLDGPGAYLMDA